jgi:hypothetical protein
MQSHTEPGIVRPKVVIIGGGFGGTPLECWVISQWTLR